jgi:hypothetical protein
VIRIDGAGHGLDMKSCFLHMTLLTSFSNILCRHVVFGISVLPSLLMVSIVLALGNKYMRIPFSTVQYIKILQYNVSINN